jgi:hypothetical protein
MLVVAPLAAAALVAAVGSVPFGLTIRVHTMGVRRQWVTGSPQNPPTLRRQERSQ